MVPGTQKALQLLVPSPPETHHSCPMYYDILLYTSNIFPLIV